MKEVWKPINGYEGRYEVSNLGRVASLNYRLKGERHLLKNDMPKNGNVSLALHGKRKTAYGRTWRFASDI